MIDEMSSRKEEIIKMAREAGMAPPDGPFITWGASEGQLERFFHMAQAAMVEQGWRKCAEGQRTTQFCGMTEKAIQEEREACAKVASGYDASPWKHHPPSSHAADMVCTSIASAIRARGNL
jgi:hypothetical protein